MTCKMCNGFGEIDCLRCRGTGLAEFNNPENVGTYIEGECPSCTNGKRECPKCQGSGLEPKNDWREQYK